MTPVIVTSHARFSVALATALLDRDAFVVIGTGSITTEVKDVQTFNWPNVTAAALPSHSGRRTAQWKAERKGRRP